MALCLCSVRGRGATAPQEGHFVIVPTHAAVRHGETEHEPVGQLYFAHRARFQRAFEDDDGSVSVVRAPTGIGPPRILNHDVVAVWYHGKAWHVSRIREATALAMETAATTVVCAQRRVKRGRSRFGSPMEWCHAG